MKNGISILIASRKKDNPNFGLPNLLQSLKTRTKDPSSIEVLIKFDDDDEGLSDIIATFDSYPFSIRHFFTPRGRGYLDLHVYYNFLYLISDRSKNLVMAMADDFIILNNGWEQIVYNQKKGAGDFVILHQWLPNLKLPFEKIIDGGYRVDEAPIWSRPLIDLCGGLGLTSSTDMWTLAIEWMLKNKFNISITRYLKRADPKFPIIDRVLCPVDLPGSNRFETDRMKIKTLVTNPNYKALALSVAENIHLHYRGLKRLRLIFHEMKLKYQRFISRLRNNPIDTNGVNLHPGCGVFLAVEGYHNYNIICLENKFYGIAQSDGAFSIERFNQNGYSKPTYFSEQLEQVKNEIKNQHAAGTLIRTTKKLASFIQKKLKSL